MSEESRSSSSYRRGEAVVEKEEEVEVEVEVVGDGEEEIGDDSKTSASARRRSRVPLLLRISRDGSDTIAIENN